MLQVTIIIERGKDGFYSAYMNDDLDFGINGQGATVDEAIKELHLGYGEIKDLYKEKGKDIPDLEFIYKYDLPSFLQYYSKVLSLAGLERLTGVNQGQLSHYITGHRKPSEKTCVKIQKALNKFGNDLSQVSFV